MFQKGLGKVGFSLVELMVVVAIIGILASLAVPQVSKFQAKARQSEAKSQLATIYSAEKAFFAEYAAYHASFSAFGYSPEGSLRYNVGFTSGLNNGNAGPSHGYNGSPGSATQTLNYCGSAGTFSGGCTVLMGTAGMLPTALTDGAVPGKYGGYAGWVADSPWDPSSAISPGACAVHTIPSTGATFVACAMAHIYQGNVDFWTMDHHKNLWNLVHGIP